MRYRRDKWKLRLESEGDSMGVYLIQVMQVLDRQETAEFMWIKQV